MIAGRRHVNAGGKNPQAPGKAIDLRTIDPHTAFYHAVLRRSLSSTTSYAGGSVCSWRYRHGEGFFPVVAEAAELPSFINAMTILSPPFFVWNSPEVWHTSHWNPFWLCFVPSKVTWPPAPPGNVSTRPSGWRRQNGGQEQQERKDKITDAVKVP